MKAFKAFIKLFEAPQRANQLTGFYMRATLALNGLILEVNFGKDLQMCTILSNG